MNWNVPERQSHTFDKKYNLKRTISHLCIQMYLSFIISNLTHFIISYFSVRGFPHLQNPNLTHASMSFNKWRWRNRPRNWDNCSEYYTNNIHWNPQESKFSTDLIVISSVMWLCDVFCYGVSDYWDTSGVWPQRRQSAVKWRAISREHDISLQYDLSQWAQEPHSFYKAAWHFSLGHFPLQGHTEDSHSPLTKYFKSYLRCENPWINGC